jgi:hypothetical protein
MAIPHVWRTHTAGAQKPVIIGNFFGLFGPNDLNDVCFPLRQSLMRRWRLAVITLLRKALKRGDLISEMGHEGDGARGGALSNSITINDWPSCSPMS